MLHFRRRLLWILEACLLVTGSILAAWFLWVWVASEVDQSWSNYELNATLKGTAPSMRGYLEHFGKDNSEKPSVATEEGEASPPPSVRLPNGATVGRIEIPRLKISAIVRHGVDGKTLSRAVGHVPQTPLPGHEGNVGLAAHRDTHFRNLKGVRVGDLIRVVTPNGNFEYEVESTKIVTPKNVEVLDPTPDPYLTLVTCYPFNYIGAAPKRFIVRAKQIMPSVSAGTTRAAL